MLKMILLACTLLVAQQDWFTRQGQEVSQALKQSPSDFKKAIDLLIEMEQKAAEQQDPDWRRYAFWRQGWCRLQLKELASAEELLEKARKLSPPGDGLLLLIHRDLGEAYTLGWKTEKAIANLQSSLEFAERSCKFKGHEINTFDDFEKSRVRMLLGQCLSREGDLQKGDLKKAREIFTSIVSDLDAKTAANARVGKATPAAWDNLQIQCEAQLAELDIRQLDAPSALRRLRRCVEKLRTRDDSYARGLSFECLITLARDYTKLARFRDAEATMSEAANLLSSIPDEMKSGDLDSLRTLLALHQLEDAIQRKPNDPQLLEKAHQAELTAQQALQHYSKAGKRTTAYTAGANVSLAHIHELQAQIYQAKHQKEKADKEFRQALAFNELGCKQYATFLAPEHDSILEFQLQRARLLCKLGDCTEARSLARNALAAFLKNHKANDCDCALFHKTLVEIEARAGDIEAAIREADANRRIATSSFVPYLAGLTASDQVSFFHFWEEPALNACLRLGIEEKTAREPSAEWLLNSKAKSGEVMAHINRHARKDPAFSSFQTLVQQQACLLYGQSRADRDASQEKLFELESEKRGLVDQRALPKSGTWYPIGLLKEKLAPDELYVDLFCLSLGDDGRRTYCAWLITKLGPVQTVELGDAEEIDQFVAKFQEHMRLFPKPRTGLYDTLGPRDAEQKLKHDALQPLSNLLLGKILPLAATKKRWTISPDGPLWNIPWSALLLPGKDEYAVEKFAFRYVISGRSLIEPLPASSSHEIWMLADPALDQKPGPNWRLRNGADVMPPARDLAHSAEEADEVLHAFADGWRSVCLMKDTMTKERLQQMTVPPRVLYFATHGFYQLTSAIEVDDPMLRCGVALTGFNYVPANVRGEPKSLPGLLVGAEVLGLNLRGTELVVLSTCESGTGASLHGQNPMDLRQAFHLAGARAVLSSLWSVDDNSTREFMAAYSGYLAKNSLQDKAEALQKAQMQAIAKFKKLGVLDRHAHPFFWAAFTLSGV